MDEFEESNSQPATPRAEKKKAPPTTVPTTTVQSEAEHTATPQEPQSTSESCKPPPSFKTRTAIEQDLLQALIPVRSTTAGCTTRQESLDTPTDHPTAEAAALRSNPTTHTLPPSLLNGDTPESFTTGEAIDMWWDPYDIHLQPTFQGTVTTAAKPIQNYLARLEETAIAPAQTEEETTIPPPDSVMP